MKYYFVKKAITSALCILLLTGVFASANPGADTITITGRFVAPCVFPAKIKMSRYSAWDSYVRYTDVTVSKDGAFTYTVPGAGVVQLGIKVDQVQKDIIVTGAERNYSIEINCDNKGLPLIAVKNSDENLAYARLYEVAQSLNDSLTAITATSGLTDANFVRIRQLLFTYRQSVLALSSQYPRTFTARILCASEMLPDSIFSSPRQLLDNYLSRAAFANPQYYSTNFLTHRLLNSYFLLRNASDTSFAAFSKALDIAGRNQGTGRLMQQVLYGVMYYQGKEAVLRSYIKWANLNPGKMYNVVVKAQLKNLESCIAGSQYIELELKDTKGEARKLSEVVAASRLTLLIFYSPTCSHCQESLPKLVPVWEQYKKKGFKIYAAGYDGTNEEWATFIRERGTSDWLNVLDTNFGKESAVKYFVSATPTYVLIDKSGKIISRLGGLDFIKKEIPKYFTD